MKATPTARPRSLITGKQMDKIVWGPNWEEILGGEFAKRSKDRNFDDIQKEIYGQFENTFMMYLPRLCEHCLNPACVASCPSGSIYKREEDGIVLIDQDKCRGWRMCVSGCPYKKIYYNWKSGKAEKCIFCYPRIEAGQPTVCSRDLRRPHPLPRRAAVRRRPHPGSGQRRARPRPVPGAARHLPRPERPDSDRAGARSTAFPTSGWRPRARARSTRWRCNGRWRCRCTRNTARCRWSGTCRRSRRSAPRPTPGRSAANGEIPDVNQLRIPVKYLANLLTAGDTAPVVRALERMLAMRAYQREKHVDQRVNTAVLEQVGITQAEVEEMYQVMAIANYEDRFVIPEHAPRVRREHVQRARRLRLLVRQRLLRRHGRDEPVRQREEAHHSHQGGGLTMFDARTRTRPRRRPCACWPRCSATPTRSCAAIWPRCASLLHAEGALVAGAPGRDSTR